MPRSYTENGCSERAERTGQGWIGEEGRTGGVEDGVSGADGVHSPQTVVEAAEGISAGSVAPGVEVTRKVSDARKHSMGA